MRDTALEEMSKAVTNALEVINNTNKKKDIIIIVLCMLLALEPIILCMIYFVTDYQYPSISQDIEQSISQNIK